MSDVAAQSDMLSDVFARQADLASYYQTMRPNGFYSWPPQDRCTTWTRAIVHECCELDNELNWKPWKNSRDLAANREERLFEMADIFTSLSNLRSTRDFAPKRCTLPMSQRTTKIAADSNPTHGTSQT